MGVTFSPVLPTAGDPTTNGAWGDDITTALNDLNNCDVYKLKTADESLNTNTTVQDDDHLAAMTLGVGSWVISAMFLVSGAAAGDVKIAWAHSGTFTGYRGGVGPSAGVTSVLTGAGAGSRTAAAADTAATITGGAIYATDGTNWSTILEQGFLVVTVSGTFKIQWAQGTSSGTNTTMRAGSYVWCRKVAS